MSSKLQKVVITGHCGFIGSHVYQYYKEVAEVVGVDIKASHPIDIRNFATLSKACEGADLIIHLAAVSSYEACEKDLQAAITTNVVGTRNVFEVARLNKSKVIFASSAAVYGKYDFPVAEYFTPAPEGVYATTKLQGELIATEYLSKGVTSTICRFFNVYGKGANSDYPGVVTRFLKDAQAGVWLNLHGKGDQQRDFIYVKDLVEILAKIDRRMDSAKWPLKINIGTGQGTSIKSLAKLVRGFASKPVGTIQTSQPGGVDISVADISIMLSEFRTIPRNLVMGLEDMFNE